jgi:hypothetical protein
MTPPVKSRRRAANLVTTFTADEVRLLFAVLVNVQVGDDPDVQPADGPVLHSAIDKFRRLREKARTGS